MCILNLTCLRSVPEAGSKSKGLLEQAAVERVEVIPVLSPMPEDGRCFCTGEQDKTHGVKASDGEYQSE